MGAKADVNIVKIAKIVKIVIIVNIVNSVNIILMIIIYLESVARWEQRRRSRGRQELSIRKSGEKRKVCNFLLTFTSNFLTFRALCLN